MIENKMKRNFIIGDSWLYYKIYSGPKTSDLILMEIINPLTSSLLNESIIDKWFFIRYNDPKYHLRLRLHSEKTDDIGLIIRKINYSVSQYFDQGLIWKIQTDTYSRELERYGNKTMIFAEEIFYFDSELIVNFLPYIEEENGEELRWLLSLRMIDIILSCFDYFLEKKLVLLENLKTGFGNEFGMNRELKKQLDNKFRGERNKIEVFMHTNESTNPTMQTLLNLLNNYKDNISPIAKKILWHHSHQQLEIDLNYLISSFIHMSMNRLFKSKNRMHEMVCYDFLYRYYKSQLARKK